MEQNEIAGLNMALGFANLTGLSGAATTFTTSAFPYSLRGKAYNNGAVAGGATPTTDFLTGLPITLVAGQGRAVLWCVDAAGNERAIAGPVVALDANGAFIDPPQLPQIPDTLCPFAYSLHRADPTTVGTWTFGVSNWNATGLVHVAQSLSTYPDRAQVS